MLVSFAEWNKNVYFWGCFVNRQAKFLLAEVEWLRAVQIEEVELFVAWSHYLVGCFLC